MDLWVANGGDGDTGVDTVNQRRYDVPVVESTDKVGIGGARGKQYLLDSDNWRFTTKNIEVFKVAF